MALQLTQREIETIRLIAHGYTSSKIALSLDISLSTTQGHIASALNKTGLSSRTELVIWALKTGILSLDEITLRHVERSY